MNKRDLVLRINSFLESYPKLSLFLIRFIPSYQVIFGKVYRKYYNSKFSSEPKIEQILDLVNDVSENTTYYKKQNWGKIHSISDFENKIKFIGRPEVLNFFAKLKSSNFDGEKYELMTTGGTSGPPAKFYVPKNRYKKEYAFYHKIWGTVGYKNHLRGVIRNKKLPDKVNYSINPITKELVFDGFRSSESYYQEIYDNLLKFKIKYIQGYPSSVANFFMFVSTKNLNIDFIKGVFLSSEIFLKHQRQLLVEKLKLPVISVYGHSEKLILAVDFKGNNEYQVIEDYGYFELIDENCQVIKEVDKVGEIVGTTYDNYGMPLIRYRTGDYSSYKQYLPNKPRLLNGIQGRWHEMKIYNKDGSFVTPTALNLHNDLLKYINGLQYYQSEKGTLVVRIIPNQNYDESVEKRFITHFKSRMANNSAITVEKVSKLNRKSNGKFLILESFVD